MNALSSEFQRVEADTRIVRKPNHRLGYLVPPLDSQSPVILILSFLMAQAKALLTHMVLLAVPHL